MDNKEKMRIILPFIVLAICVPIIVDFFIFGNSFHSNISNESSISLIILVILSSSDRIRTVKNLM